MRMAQVSGLAFLFAPLTTVASANISREDNGDATSPFTMARNVSGSIGVSAATALVVERTPARMVHLAPHMTPLDQGYAVSLQQYEQLVLAYSGGLAITWLAMLFAKLRGKAR
jgi:MFS transporter, DHA2 family, multidrug resistance protein